MRLRGIVLGLLLLGYLLAPEEWTVPTMADENVKTEMIKLWPGIAPGSEGVELEEKDEPRRSGKQYNIWTTNVTEPTLQVFLPPEDKRNGTAVVICPGGGYAGLSMIKEGTELAEWFCERGIVGANLKYRCTPFKHPIPLHDAQRALRILHSRAEEWKLKPEQIGIAGFSAGGHLAATAGTHFDTGKTNAEDSVDEASCRPHFLILIYPVISFDPAIYHGGSRKRLIGENPPQQLVDELSNEKQVTSETGPTFLVHAYNDRTVPVENSLRFYEALRKHKVPAEMHLYETGGHGFGFLRRDQSVDRWPELLEPWLKGRGLLD